MEFLREKPTIKDSLLMLIGTAIMAVGISSIYDSMNLVTGGVTGLAIIIKGISIGLMEGGIPLWLTNLVLNIPLFAAAVLLKGKRFLVRTMFATLSLSGWLYILPPLKLIENDLLLAAVFGGLLGGIGIGMVLAANATTGGTDLLAVLIHTKVRHYSVVEILQVIDALIVVVGAYTFGVSKALYAIIAIFITTRVSDFMVDGVNFSKLIYIITEKHEEIAKRILELDRGITSVDAKGMYSGNQKNMLFCVVSKKEIVEVKDIIKEIDPKAFVIVTDAREVLGEGFIEVGK